MVLRINDVLIGVITGAVASVVAAGFEVFIAALRLFSFGHLGGAFGSKILWIAIFGAVVGGLVGWILGAFMKPREREHVR